jgi:imidazolonepropionase-like amidohydrolase
MIDAMKKTNAALVPTLYLWEYELRHDRSPVRARFAAIAIGQLERWNHVGGIVLFGTDVGYHSHYDPTGEYVLMAEAGMSGREILASLTTAPAEQFGESSRLGRIALVISPISSYCATTRFRMCVHSQMCVTRYVMGE